MRLLDLDARWLDVGPQGRRGTGILFDCPARATCLCPDGRHALLLHNPLDGGPRLTDAQMMDLPAHFWAWHPGSQVRCWHRVGDTLDTLSLSPRIDAAGGWSAWISGGRVLLGGPAPRALALRSQTPDERVEHAAHLRSLGQPF